MVKPRPRRICRKFKKCCVYTCLNSTVIKPRLKYFKLPTDLKRRAETLRLVLRDDLLDKPLTNPYYICKRHYSRKDIENNKLTSTALPRYNLPTKSVAVQTHELRCIDNSTQTEGIFRSEDLDKMGPPRSSFVPRKTLREPLKNEPASKTVKGKDKTKQKDKMKRVKKDNSQAPTATKDRSCKDDTKDSIGIISKENIEVANKDSKGTKTKAKDQVTATESMDITDKIKEEIIEDLNDASDINSARKVRRHSKCLRYVIDKEIVIDMPDENDNNGVPFDDPTNIVDVNNPKNIVITKDIFFRISENLLTKDLCEVVKAQIEIKLNECGTTSKDKSEYNYSQDYLNFCKTILNTSSKAYCLLQRSLRLPRPALIKRLLH